jgi:hypothetical protein
MCRRTDLRVLSHLYLIPLSVPVEVDQEDKDMTYSTYYKTYFDYGPRVHIYIEIHSEKKQKYSPYEYVDNQNHFTCSTK